MRLCLFTFNSKVHKMWSVSVICSVFFSSLVSCDPIRSMPEREPLRQRMLEYASLPGVMQKIVPHNAPVMSYDEELKIKLPESFDPRNKWPACSSLKEIRDQGKCGACWAVSTVSALTDRICIFSNGTQQFHFSAQDMLTCSTFDGCHGGSPSDALEYWVQEGIVSGGNYGSDKGCQPYNIPTCPHHVRDCTNYTVTPECKNTCRDGYNVTYGNDKLRGKKWYSLDTVESMMAELYTNGPFVSCLEIYEDFANYTGGVYQHVNGNLKGHHAVKVMGWGVEDGKKYWLIANSWGTDFGENGFFKILRGNNECRIESCGNVAGVPRT